MEFDQKWPGLSATHSEIKKDIESIHQEKIPFSTFIKEIIDFSHFAELRLKEIRYSIYYIKNFNKN